MTGSEASSKTGYLLLKIQYGAPGSPTYARFTNNDVEVEGDDGTYSALPVKVTGLGNTGALDAKRIELDMEQGNSDFLDLLSDGTPSSPVFLHVTEVLTAYGPSASGDPDEDVSSLRHAIGDYRLERGLRNPDRQAGLLRLVFVHYKSRLGVPLGIVCNPACAWTLGDKSCQADVTPETATIAAITGKRITLTDPDDADVVTSKPAGDSPYWHRGYATVAGLPIGIRLWEDGSYELHLVKEPPASWLNAEVELTPGCAKTPGDCNSKFTNLEHFGGLGISIPAYQPDRELS